MAPAPTGQHLGAPAGGRGSSEGQEARQEQVARCKVFVGHLESNTSRPSEVDIQEVTGTNSVLATPSNSLPELLSSSYPSSSLVEKDLKRLKTFENS